MAFDRKSYDSNYQRDTYDVLTFKVPKGKKQELKEFAAIQETTVSDLIVRAVWKCYKINLREK